MAQLPKLILLLSIFSSTCLADAPDSAKVGVLLTMSGSFAAVGKDGREGVESALSMLGAGSKLSVQYSDSKSDPTTAVGEFRRLTTVEQVSGVYVFRGPIGAAVNPISRSSKVPLLGGIGNKDCTTVNEYAFQVWPRSDVEGAFLASKLKELGITDVAVITVQDDWTSSVSAGFREAFIAGGGKLVFDQEIIPTDTDFRTLLLQMSGKAPKAVFINVSIGQIGPILKQLKERDSKIPVFSNFWVGKKDVVEAAGNELLEGVRFVEMDSDLPALKEHLKATYGSAPSGATVSAYVATTLLYQAAQIKAGTSAELFDSLLKQTEVKTSDRTFAIKDRCVQFPLVLKAMHEGKGVKQ